MARLLAVFTKNSINPAYHGARLGAERVANRLGFAVRHYVPDRPDDVGQQSELLAAALRDRPDAILLNPAHPTALNNGVTQAVRQGVPVVLFINRLTGADSLTFVGADDEALAYDMAKYLCQRLSPTAAILILDGPYTARTAVERALGCRAAFMRYASGSQVRTVSADYQREPARVATARLIEQGFQIDGVMAANDLMALGALDALEAAGQSARVVGVNALPEAVAAVAAGRLLATASFDAMGMACIATEAAIRKLRGELLPKELLLPVEIVDKNNHAAWSQPYEQRKCPDWEHLLEQNRIDSNR